MLANTAFLLTRLQVLHGRAQKKASSGRMLICIKENTAEMLSWNSDRAQSAALVGLLELNNFTLIFFFKPIWLLHKHQTVEQWRHHFVYEMSLEVGA